MFNQFNVCRNINIKAELFKNRRESIMDITDYISKISYKLNSPSVIDVKISKYGMNKNIKEINSVYDKIKNNMQIVLTINGKKERYILYDDTKKSNKNSGEKTFTGYSFEKTLENKLILFSSTGKSYPLINDGTMDGVLDIVSTITGWKIGYVDDLAKSEYVNIPATKKVNVVQSLNHTNIQVDQLLWSANVNIKPSIDTSPLNITVEHSGIIRYDSYGDKITDKENYSIELDPLHAGLTNIKAYYYSVAGNRYGVRFVMTLADKSVVTQTKEFINLENLKMTCENINLIYETGYLEKQYVTKYVWLENIDSNVYNFLKDMQDEFNILFIFDSYNNVINCYSKDNMLDETPLMLSFDSNVIDLEVKQAENPISAVRVVGANDLSIIDINKYGSDIIYNYSYFRNNELISQELDLALSKYDAYLEHMQTVWDKLSEDRRLLYDNKIKLDCEIKSLTERIVTLSELLSAFIASNSSSEEQLRIKKEKAELEKLFNSNISLRNSVEKNIAQIDASMSKISTSIKRDKCGIFTSDDVLELNDIDIIENYSNDVATTSDALYNCATWYLNERTRPTVEFSVKCNNLIKLIKNPLGWNNILQLGKLVYLDEAISKDIGENQARLTGMDINVKDKKVDNLSFTNKLFPIDLLKMAKKMQKKAVAVALNNSTYKSALKDSKNTNDIVADMQNGGINLSVMPLKTSYTYSVAEDSTDMMDGSQVETFALSVMSEDYSVEEDYSYYSIDNNIYENEESIPYEEYVDIYNDCDNDIEQSSAGIFIKSKTNPNKQLYIGAGLFAISSNGFETSEIAVDSEGITAKLLKGQIILGEKLYITSDDGSETFYIGSMEEKDGFGLRIKDETTGQERIFLGTEIDENGIKKAKLRLVGKNGEVAISEDGIVNTYCLVYHDDLDSEHPLVFDYPIDEGTFEVRECKVSLYLQKYRMTVKSLSSGGSISTTTEGGAVVNTTGEGGYTSTSTANGGVYTDTISSAESVEYPYQTATSTQIDNSDGTHVHSYYYGVPKHKHSVVVNVPNHTHTFTVQNHNHSINIAPHSHTLDTTHNHELQAGIFESSTPSNCVLYVNDILVLDNINENISVDIRDYLVLGQNNNIKITSKTLGRIQISILNKSFVTN